MTDFWQGLPYSSTADNTQFFIFYFQKPEMTIFSSIHLFAIANPHHLQ
jgi:hypothetical protein